MSYIKGVTLSAPSEGRMECDGESIVVTTPLVIDDILAHSDDYNGGHVDMVREVVFRPSAYQLRALAEWAVKTADSMEDE